MSQGDYLQRKKLGTVLNIQNQSKLPKSLASEDYTLFKQYSLENTIINTSDVYNQIVTPNSMTIFNMEVSSASTCPQFKVCNNTQERENRLIPTDPIAFNPYVSSKPTYVSSYMGTDTGYTTKQNTTITYRSTAPPIRTCCAPPPSKNSIKPKGNTDFTSSRMARLKASQTSPVTVGNL
jgi:hypothetical protein